PACYGNGGTLPTCTDADLLLGYLDPDYFLGGRMRLLHEPAERAVREHLAEPLGISVEEAAVAAFEVVNAGMAAGVRDMIVDHSLDPEAMPMVVGGGAGPVHAAAVAMELGVREVVVPRQSGVFCAVGMLFADLKHDLVRSYCASGEQLDPGRWRTLFAAMADEGRRTLVSEGARPEEVELRYSADLRYLRQVHELKLLLDESLAERLRIDELHARFDVLHERLFGYALPEEVLEVVNLRVRCVARRPRPELSRAGTAGTAASEPDGSRRAYSPGEMSFREFAVYRGETLGGSCRLQGPAIVELPQTTLVVPSAFAVALDEAGSFVLTRRDGPEQGG
ncbi:MAG: hydantoinase/oxoprolinase family protein, partial [Gammaproteobacteria bacterium]|nr:hydantoinase/oxoprolinase family protein [Gammaproteobacteria bacterium]